jgi:hypothetical protein
MTRLASFAAAALLLAGCSKGADLAFDMRALAECLQTANAACKSMASTGAEMRFERATMFTANDSVRTTAQVSSSSECEAFGNVAGHNQANTRVAINDVVVKAYGEEYKGAIKKVCDEPGPYEVALTVAKVPLGK